MNEKVKEIKKLLASNLWRVGIPSDALKYLEYLLSLLSAQEARIKSLESEKSYWNCPTHGKSQNAWECPECVRELREGIRDVLTESTISYVVEKRLKKLIGR